MECKVIKLKNKKISLPQHGETWEKKPCPKGLCSMGHSLGVGIHIVDKTTNFNWGTEEQIKCGCLIKLEDADE